MPIRLALIALGAAALLAGCGSSEGPATDGLFSWESNSYPDYSSGKCVPGSCSGCCDSTGTCVNGLSTSACGVNGVQCQVCKSSDTCQYGFCTAPKCDATSCPSGCCDSAGKCAQGNSDTDCGKGGQTCQACTSSEVCTNNQCTAKGAAMYKITLVSAKVDGGITACGLAELSECDLYVILKVGNATATSTIKGDTNNPTWNEYMLTATESDILKKFDVEVRDDDPISYSGMGTCQPKITSSDLSAGTHTSDCGDTKSLTWSFTSI